MRVGDLCDRKPITVSVAAPASDAARLMCEEDIGAVVVTAMRSGQAMPVGMLTDRDIVCAQLDRAVDLGELCSGDIMTADPLVLDEDAPIEQAIHLLRDRRVRRAPVIGHSGELIGMISFDNLLAQVAGNLRSLAHLVEAHAWAPRHERRGRAKPGTAG